MKTLKKQLPLFIAFALVFAYFTGTFDNENAYATGKMCCTTVGGDIGGWGICEEGGDGWLFTGFLCKKNPPVPEEESNCNYTDQGDWNEEGFCDGGSQI